VTPLSLKCHISPIDFFAVASEIGQENGFTSQHKPLTIIRLSCDFVQRCIYVSLSAFMMTVCYVNVNGQGNSGLKPKEGEVISQPWQWPLNYRVSYCFFYLS